MLLTYGYNPWCSLHKYNIKYLFLLCVHSRKKQYSWGQICSKVWAEPVCSCLLQSPVCGHCWGSWSLPGWGSSESTASWSHRLYLFLTKLVHGINGILINMLFCLVIKPNPFLLPTSTVFYEAPEVLGTIHSPTQLQKLQKTLSGPLLSWWGLQKLFKMPAVLFSVWCSSDGVKVLVLGPKLLKF